jgi:hypothetical protein
MLGSIFLLTRQGGGYYVYNTFRLLLIFSECFIYRLGNLKTGFLVPEKEIEELRERPGVIN